MYSQMNLSILKDAQAKRDHEIECNRLAEERKSIWIEFNSNIDPYLLEWYMLWKRISEAGSIREKSQLLSHGHDLIKKMERCVIEWGNKAQPWLEKAHAYDELFCIRTCINFIEKAYSNDEHSLLSNWANTIFNYQGIKEYINHMHDITQFGIRNEIKNTIHLLEAMNEGYSANQFEELILAWGGIDFLEGLYGVVAMTLIPPSGVSSIAMLPMNESQTEDAKLLIRTASMALHVNWYIDYFGDLLATNSTLSLILSAKQVSYSIEHLLTDQSNELAKVIPAEIESTNEIRLISKKTDSYSDNLESQGRSDVLINLFYNKFEEIPQILRIKKLVNDPKVSLNDKLLETENAGLFSGNETSNELARIFGYTAAAVRQTRWWKSKK